MSAFDERDVLVFSDYDCPACKALFEELDSIAAAPGRRTLRVFQLPPAGNPEATEASLTAICGDMHSRFGQIHRALFADGNRTLPSRKLEALSAAAGFEDTTALRRCITSPEAKTALDQDLAMASVLGLDVTPIVVIDGTIYRGAPRRLRRILESSESPQ